MTKQTPVAMTDNDGGDQADDDLASQRTRLVDDLAWLVVRSHRRRNTAAVRGGHAVPSERRVQLNLGFLRAVGARRRTGRTRWGL